MFRGISSFHHVVDEELSAPATPKGSKKTKQFNNSKNPYSSRGLDKFSSVLSDLEARKEKIMARTSSAGRESTIVRFKHSKSQDWVPIVVRLREDSNSSNTASPKKPKPKETTQAPISPMVKEVKKHVTWSEGEVGNSKKRSGGDEYYDWWKSMRPSYYMMAVVLLILLCLALSGRVFAICCTAVCWYLVPKFMGTDHHEGGKIRRRSLDYVRKLSTSSQVKKMGGGGVLLKESASPRACNNFVQGKG